MSYNMIRLPNGKPAISQGYIQGYYVSYNPDDELFYIHPDSESHEVITTCSTWQEVRNWTKEHWSDNRG